MTDTTLSNETATHIEDFGQFMKDFNQSAKCVLPPKANIYDQVHVLLVRWKDDDLGTETEINDLESVFRGKYRYATERYLIPSKNSEIELEDKLVAWRKAHASENNLLILYYGGHGALDLNRKAASRSIWQANLRTGSPQLCWSDLQPTLQRSNASVLFILDCCYAATAARGTSGTKEGLWACNSEVETTGVNDNSFTRNLIAELEALHGTRYNVAMLHQKLIERFKRPGPHTLLMEACYSFLGDSIKPSIEIAPLLQSTQIPSTIKIPYSETLVMLAVRVSSEGFVPDLAKWQSWLHHASPADVHSVLVLGKSKVQDILKIEGYYTSHSEIILVSMPICLWDRLPKSRAYQFIAFIKSSNNLNRNHFFRGKPLIELPSFSALDWMVSLSGTLALILSLPSIVLGVWRDWIIFKDWISRLMSTEFPTLSLTTVPRLLSFWIPIVAPLGLWLATLVFLFRRYRKSSQRLRSREAMTTYSPKS